MTAVSWLMHHTEDQRSLRGRGCYRFMGSYDHRAYEPAQALQGSTHSTAAGRVRVMM